MMGIVAITRRRRGSTTGLSLIELLLAVFVLVAAGSGILGAYLSTQALSKAAKETLIATNDLKDVMERVRGTTFTNVLTQFPDGVANGPVTNNYATIVGGYTLPNEQITVTYPSQTSSRLEMRVTVAWTQNGRQRSIGSSTYRTSG